MASSHQETSEETAHFLEAEVVLNRIVLRAMKNACKRWDLLTAYGGLWDVDYDVLYKMTSDSKRYQRIQKLWQELRWKELLLGPLIWKTNPSNLKNPYAYGIDKEALEGPRMCEYRESIVIDVDEIPGPLPRPEVEGKATEQDPKRERDSVTPCVAEGSNNKRSRLTPSVTASACGSQTSQAADGNQPTAAAAHQVTVTYDAHINIGDRTTSVTLPKDNIVETVDHIEDYVAWKNSEEGQKLDVSFEVFDSLKGYFLART
ncbi:uncharacterized protein BKA78DRAFT_321803 [Phyllosticta capitalensis]|uniref:uncharacterized protein n=1 Tax=Phyllosticta capitalensis TaxID=121624 RepID=UPI003130C5DC